MGERLDEAMYSSSSEDEDSPLQTRIQFTSTESLPLPNVYTPVGQLVFKKPAEEFVGRLSLQSDLPELDNDIV